MLGLKNTGLSTPAYPDPIDRFITMHCFAFQTSITGMPAEGLNPAGSGVGRRTCDDRVGIFHCGGVDGVICANDHGDISVWKVRVDFLHLFNNVVAKKDSRESLKRAGKDTLQQQDEWSTTRENYRLAGR